MEHGSKDGQYTVDTIAIHDWFYELQVGFAKKDIDFIFHENNK
jgi:hypothetical protein